MNIYLVASYESLEPTSKSRTWGWFPSLEEARQAVQTNFGDLHEGTFAWLVIEEMPEGVCVVASFAEWYAWCPDGNDRYEGSWTCVGKPKVTDGVVNWTIG